MGWRGALRTIAADARRWEREARRREREAQKAYAAASKQQAAEDAAERARLEVELFESHIESLTSVHQERIDSMDWVRIRKAKRPPGDPAPPDEAAPVARYLSEACERALAEHQPGFFEKLFGLKGPKRRLEQAIVEARAEDDAREARSRAEREQVLVKWREACAKAQAAREEWSDRCELADRLLAGDTDAYREVIESLDSLGEIGSVLPSQTLAIQLTAKRAIVEMRVAEDTVVPVEEKKLTARSAVSRKKMAAAKRSEIYEDYVCGVALRVARELLAAVPIERVVVHIDTPMLNGATGHIEPATILSVIVPREAVEGVNWSNVDASDCVDRLKRSMKRLGRGKGFGAVERLDAGP